MNNITDNLEDNIVLIKNFMNNISNISSDEEYNNIKKIYHYGFKSKDAFWIEKYNMIEAFKKNINNIIEKIRSQDINAYNDIIIDLIDNYSIMSYKYDVLTEAHKGLMAGKCEFVYFDKNNEKHYDDIIKAVNEPSINEKIEMILKTNNI
ncbi:hypothetical protein CBEVV_002 [Choristoneura biennis entomopoxvirus 'L' virophage]|nr:hypothetical protein CBEVV_002 [Choristoneura biennis entomopoxvirus 'L' virophage]